MTRRWLMAAAAALLTACGGQDAAAPAPSDPEPAVSASAEPSAEPTVPATEEESPDTGESEAAVTAEDFNFSPATVEVTAGGTVTWTNADEATHTVTAGTPEAPRTELFDFLLPSDSPTASMRFEEPGDVAYFCSIHPTMLGTVTVV